MFSPVLEFDIGLNIVSNAKDHYVDFFIGPSFNAYGFHVKRLAGQTLNGFHDEKVFFDSQKGIGFEVQVQYTFPMKKQLAKKASE